jgi:nitroreductase
MTRTAATEVPLHPLLAERWSPRGFDRDHQVSEAELTALLEAARWASSANNVQPWRFLVTRRGDADFAAVVDVLAPGNQIWARHASALLLVAAQTTDENGKPRSHALYDTGQAVAQLVAQAQAEGLATHQMGGFDGVRAVDELGLDDLTPVVVVAIGRQDADAALPEPFASRETAPRTRRPLADLVLTVGERRDTRTSHAA